MFGGELSGPLEVVHVPARELHDDRGFHPQLACRPKVAAFSYASLGCGPAFQDNSQQIHGSLQFFEQPLIENALSELKRGSHSMPMGFVAQRMQRGAVQRLVPCHVQ